MTQWIHSRSTPLVARSSTWIRSLQGIPEAHTDVAQDWQSERSRVQEQQHESSRVWEQQSMRHLCCTSCIMFVLLMVRLSVQRVSDISAYNFRHTKLSRFGAEWISVYSALLTKQSAPFTIPFGGTSQHGPHNALGNALTRSLPGAFAWRDDHARSRAPFHKVEPRVLSVCCWSSTPSPGTTGSLPSYHARSIIM